MIFKSVCSAMLSCQCSKKPCKCHEKPCKDHEKPCKDHEKSCKCECKCKWSSICPIKPCKDHEKPCKDHEKSCKCKCKCKWSSMCPIKPCKDHRKSCKCKWSSMCLIKPCIIPKIPCIWPKVRCVDHCENLILSNCVEFSGTSNTVPNTIFNIEEDSIPVVLAGSIENFSNDGINVIFSRMSGQVTITVLANSSISFVYDDITAINVFGFGQAYTGSFKYQATYSIEK